MVEDAFLWREATFRRRYRTIHTIFGTAALSHVHPLFTSRVPCRIADLFPRRRSTSIVPAPAVPPSTRPLPLLNVDAFRLG